VLVLIAIGQGGTAQAEERVAVLARMLKSSSEKTRLAAVLSLAKLGDPAAEKPLVTALRDRNMRVRAVAATALGRLDCDAALPTLRVLAVSDAENDVRQAASNAALKIAKSSHQRDERIALVDAEARRTASGHPSASRARQGEPHAELYLLINSSADDSPGRPDKVARKTHAEIVKRALVAKFKTEASITSVAAEAQRWGLIARHLDLSVTKLDATRAGAYVEVDAQLRLAISDDNGKMLSFLSGGAKVQVPADKFQGQYLPALRKEALESAMQGMFGKLLAHLRDQPAIAERP
jgi:HEAT repeat protein